MKIAFSENYQVCDRADSKIVSKFVLFHYIRTLLYPLSFITMEINILNQLPKDVYEWVILKH